MRISLVVLLLALSACNVKHSAYKGGAKASGSFFSASCPNPVSVSERAGETLLKTGMTEATGKWELESLVTHFEFQTGDGAPGMLASQYKNGIASVTCHNSHDTVAAGQKSDSTMNSKMNVPFVMDADNKTISAEATLKAHAVRGQTSQEFNIVNVVKPLPPTESVTLPNIKSQLVRTNGGKLILRAIIDLKNTEGSGTTVMSMEAVYKPKR